MRLGSPKKVQEHPKAPPATESEGMTASLPQVDDKRLAVALPPPILVDSPTGRVTGVRSYDRPTLNDDQVFAVLGKAELDGMAGQCGAAALAINAVLFDRQGTYMVAYNGPIYEKKGRFFGHVAVKAPNGVLWDAEGETDQETIESWGMLAPDDPDYAKVYGRGWTEAKAETTVFREVEEDFIDGLLDTTQDLHMMRLLRDARESLAM